MQKSKFKLPESKSEMKAMNKKPTVAVLMSTYNGEQFIREQLDSIFCQESVEVSLYVRDDGSTDSTLKIIEGYGKNHQICILPFDGNVGPGMSFMRLLYYVIGLKRRYDYYAFADQDDLWLPDKLIRAISMIKDAKKRDVRNILYCSNQWLYENEKKTRLRFAQKPDISLAGHISKNDFSGCTMVFAYDLAELTGSIPCPGNDILTYRMHDAWMALVASAYGTILYDEESRILYRIHGGNTVGVKETVLKDRIDAVLGKGSKPKYRHVRSNSAALLLKIQAPISPKDRCILKDVAYYRSQLKYKRHLLKRQDIYIKSGESRGIYFLKVLLNII